MNIRRTIPAVLLIAAGAVTLTACGPSGQSADQKDTQAVGRNFNTMEGTQPAPQGDWSQLRQTIIDAEQAQIHGVATTSFFYNQGSPRPVLTCPSLGFPVPASDQLTNPTKIVSPWNGSGPVTLPQGEPNGVYTGDTTGTYVVCVLGNGQKQVDYWEGYVYTAGGQAHLGPDGSIVEDSSTVKSGTK